jgi:cytochrome c peroxidase
MSQDKTTAMTTVRVWPVAVAVAGILLAAGTWLGVRRSHVGPSVSPVVTNAAQVSSGEVKPHGSTSASPDAGPPQSSSARISLGRTIFFDKNLSVPTGMSCATCHDPTKAFAGNNGSKLGVALGSRPDHFAKRNTPSVLYLRFIRKFHLHWEEDAPLVGAFGGFFWDGRTDSIVDLVKQPLLNPDEMNNGSVQRIAEVIASSTYAEDFEKEFGADTLKDPEAALKGLSEAVNAYLLSSEMSPFTSKYDDYVRGRAELTPVEANGLKLFRDPAKGACSSCHKLNPVSPDPSASLFTDYGFDAVAVPRNRALPAARDPSYFDLGLCERRGDDYKSKTDEFCGKFRTPSLRNVAVRSSFMHNGAFSNLRDVVSFYATRGTSPKRWYKFGVVFDDMPEKYRECVNSEKAPYNRREGQKPPLDDTEIDALVAFLGTLTDAQFR